MTTSKSIYQRMSRWNTLVSDDFCSRQRQSIQWENLFVRLRELTTHTKEDYCHVAAIDLIINDLSRLLLQYQYEELDPSILRNIIQTLLLPPYISHEGALLLIANLWSSRKRTVTLTSHQCTLCLEHLCRLPRSDVATQAISTFIVQFHNKLPAEKIASDIIEPIMLHNLETTRSKSQRDILYHTLTTLLQQDQYASALLAPLTTHIDDRGYESTTPNPIGIRHLSLLESHLPTSHHCMTATMHAIRRVQSQSTLCPNMVTLEKSLLLSLNNNNNNNNNNNKNNHYSRDTALTLLKAVLQTYPILAATRLRSLLLGKQAILGKLIHHHDLAVQCCTQMIYTMPLQQWMNSYFSQQLNDACLKLLQELLTMKDLPIRLCTAVLTKIPFAHDPAQPLTAAALDVVDRITAMDACHDTVACIVQCMGGKLLSNGERTNMAIPMAVYLKQSRATPFLQSLWANLTIDNDQRRANAVEILGGQWTVDIDSLYLNPDSWERFQRVMKEIVTNENQTKRKDGMVLLETVLAARKVSYTLVPADGVIVSFVFRLLLDCVVGNKSSPSILLPTCGIYSSMATPDWEFLFHNDCGWSHAHFILDMCHNGNASVRAAACKACGELCTSFLSLTSTFQQPLCLEMVAAMSISLDDKNINVRSMAAFCVGNLALAIRGQSCFFDLATLCQKVVHLVGDSNGKVINNAIRAVGHLGFLAFHEQLQYRPENNNDHDWSRLYQQLVTAMNLKIAPAVDTSISQRTWKERSSAKKHAWGACHALECLLDGSEAIYHENSSVSRASLELLIRCLDGASSETEKIFIAASSAILHIPITSLQILSHRHGLVGLAIFKCTNTLLEAKVSFSRCQQKRQSVTADLLNHLLKAMSILDATSLFRLASTAPLEFLYDWMVNHNVSADAFESLALVFADFSGCVSLQQRFASRATERHRRETENGIEGKDFGMDSVDDSDEDEL